MEDGLKAALQDRKTQTIFSAKDVDESNKLHRKWRRSLICKGIDRLLSGASLTGDPLEEPESMSEDEDEDSKAPHAITTEANLPTPLSQPPASLGDSYTLADDRRPASTHLSRISTSPVNVATRLKLPDNIWRLLDIYFNYTHNWLPIVEKHDILKVIYSYPPDGIELLSNSPGSGEHALLWSILAMASIQEASITPGSTALSCPPNELLKISRGLISQTQIELGHAQALLLHSLIQSGSSDFKSAWIILGHAIRAALLVDSSLLSKTGNFNRPTDLSSKRIQHLLIGCFILDTILSANLHKIPMLKVEHFSCLGLLLEDSLEEWHPWEGCTGFGSQAAASSMARVPSHSLSIFNQLSRLMRVLSGHISDERTIARHSETSILPQLDQWSTMLPPDCKLNPDSNPQFTPQKLALHLTFQGISASFGLPNEQQFAFTEIVQLFKLFSYHYGDAALPPFFAAIFHNGFGIINSLPTDSYQFIQDKIATLNDIWEIDIESKEVAIGTTPTVDPPLAAVHTTSRPSKNLVDMPMDQNTGDAGWIGIPFASPPNAGLTSQFPTHNLADTSSIAGTSTQSRPRDVTIQNPLSTNLEFVDTNQLQRYNSMGSFDLDALFDDLDGPERANTQPQFMQNLGFAPGADLTDILASDYGQFDPLLTAYMSGNALGLQASDPGRIFDPG